MCATLSLRLKTSKLVAGMGLSMGFLGRKLAPRALKKDLESEN
tara:strand:- start:266 stop:394 length:129 start_codon:yes stop_codon:yes gene_type:complete